MRSDPVDLIVAFVLGALFAATLIVGWAYNSAQKNGRLPKDDEPNE
jgi:glycerol uptake facilitator-like aquaporin